MFKKTVTYVDYDGVERTEDFYFNLTASEMTEMQMMVDGGYGEMVQKAIAKKDAPKLMAIFKDLILKSYGEKSADGRRFIKSEELSKEFTQTEAYDVIFMELCTDENAAAKFMNAVLPAEKLEAIKAKQNA